MNLPKGQREGALGHEDIRQVLRLLTEEIKNSITEEENQDE